jgi:uncharacterized protein (TIGR04255 family)
MPERPTAEYEPLRFKNPPIVEAVIGVTIDSLPESVLDPLRNAAVGVSGYKEPQPILLANFLMTYVPGAPKASAHDAPHGWQIDSNDGLYRGKFQRDGFLFSQLGRYVSWELFRGEAYNLWRHYVAAIGDHAVTEFGVRYINKVHFPIDAELSDYLTCFPTIPDGVPPSISESFMRLVLPIQNPDGKLTHLHILVAPEKPGFATVILDNDFRFQARGLADSELWHQIDLVRRVKDEFFRKLVTEKMRKTFDD